MKSLLCRGTCTELLLRCFFLFWFFAFLVASSDALLWRTADCLKNSVSQLAQAHFAHTELQGMSRPTQLALLQSPRCRMVCRRATECDRREWWQVKGRSRVFVGTLTKHEATRTQRAC